MSRTTIDDKNPPPSLVEQYEAAASTSDLGLPRGDSAGAQGILAAAAWTDVHLGSALLRLRGQWERERPTRKIPLTRELLMAAGNSRDQARASHKRQRIEYAKAYYRERTAALRSLHGLPEVLADLTWRAAWWDMEDPDLKAFTVLHQWLDRRGEVSFGEEGRRLMTYLDDCVANARKGLAAGMRGHTKHEKAEEG